MSDGGTDPTSLAVGAAVTGAIALAFGFIKGLFNRNVGAADKAQEEMRTDVKNILLELRSMHDEQTRQRSDIASLTEKNATLKEGLKAVNERIDALVSPAPRGGRK
jgi:peptidoglycan hydrolase CwlO-like protein